MCSPNYRLLSKDHLAERRGALEDAAAAVVAKAKAGELPDVRRLDEGGLSIMPLRAITPPRAMGGGNLQIGAFCVSWPTGEFGGMGLEGKVKLGNQRQFAAIQDPAERLALYEKLVAEEYERGKALNVGSLYEVDDVIDPAETRKWIVAGLRAMPPVPKREGKKRGWVDAW